MNSSFAPTSSPCTSSSDAVLRTAWSQLERMRSMQYAYHRKFFSWLALSTATFILLWIFGGKSGLLWIPFAVITCGMQASFYLHFCDFARTHAAHLEHAINQRLGFHVLLGAKLENDYFYPLQTPKISGWSAGSPLSFFSIFTLHWCVVWAGIAASALINGFSALSPDGGIFYLFALFFWAGANVSFLTWYFWRHRDLSRVDARLRDNLFQEFHHSSVKS